MAAHFGTRWRSALILAAVAAGALPFPRTLVERAYSGTLYPAWQPAVTRASNLAPFALIDLLIVLVAAWWIGTLVHDVRTRRARTAAARVLVRTITAAAAMYLAFLVVWGFNYRRVPLDQKLPFDAAAVTPASARELALAAVAQVNVLHARAGGSNGSGGALVGAFHDALRMVGAPAAIVPGVPKRSLLLDAYFRRAAVDGMTDPYFLETLVNSALLPIERPFVLAHEWSHLAGFADEGEANFIGWLACDRGAPADRYSGWLFLYVEAANALPAADRRDAASRLDAGPRADLQAIAARIRRDVSPAVSMAGWRIYDRYLKANRVEAGAASYGGVVRLVLGTGMASGVMGRMSPPRGSPW